MSLELLYTETTSPEYNGLTDLGIAQAINSKTRSVSKPVKVGEIQRYFEQIGVANTLEAIAKDSSHAAYDLARAAMRIISTSMPDVDMYHATTQTLLGGLATVGIITADQKTAAQELGDTTEPYSIGLGYQVVTKRDVEAAKARHGGA